MLCTGLSAEKVYPMSIENSAVNLKANMSKGPASEAATALKVLNPGFLFRTYCSLYTALPFTHCRTKAKFSIL